MRITTVNDFGNVIHELRTQRGWSQARLATEVGVSREWVSRVETGSRPDVETALLLRTLHTLGAVVTVSQAPTRRLDPHLEPS